MCTIKLFGCMLDVGIETGYFIERRITLNMKTKKLISYVLSLTMIVGLLSNWQSIKVDAATAPVVEEVYYNITNVCTGRMIDIPSGTDEDKVQLHTWTINNSNAEQFKFEKVAGEDCYYIVPKVAPTRVIDTPSSSTTAGTQLQIYTKNSTDAQKFILESDGDGNYRIINKNSQMALTDMTDEKGTTDEEKDNAIRQQAVADDSRQLWKITKLADDYVFNEPSKPDGADPSMVLAGGKYYYCFAGAGNTIKIAPLSSLENMSSFTSTTVFTAPSDEMYSKDIWAPELVWVSGKWYVYFAADDGTNANHRMYVLEGGSNPDNPLDGSYTFKGKIYDTSNDRWAIDGTVFTYNSENYFVWSGWDVSDGNQQNLYIAKMSNPWTLSTSRVCISTPTNSWEKSGSSSINEGPEVLINGSKVHIIFSAAGSWTDNYCLGRITCTDGNFLNASSWTKSADPVFQKTEYTFGPGHNTFVKSVDGTENWIIYHCARYSGSKWTRSIRAQRFTWTDSGYPFFGEPIEQGVAVSRPSKEYNPPVNTTNYYKIVNVGTGKVLDIPNKEDANGVKLQTYTNNDTIAQRFRFKTNPDKWFNIIPKCAQTRAIDNPSGSKDKNISYQIYSANGTPSQKFRFEYMGDGKYRIVNKASLFALTDTSEISGSTGYVEQRKYMNSDYQLWQIIPMENEESYEAMSNVNVSTDQSWTDLGAWSYYFGDWNNSNGTYSGGSTADKFTVNITSNNKAQWGIQIALDNQSVIEGHEYRYTVNVNSSAAGSILSKDDISRLKEDITSIVAGDNVVTGTFTATSSEAKILLELASGIDVGTTLKFTGFTLEDLTAVEETTTEQQTTTAEETTTVEQTTQPEETTEVVTEEETTTAGDITVDENGLNISDKVDIIGYQISVGYEGFRVIGAVEPEIDGRKVSQWGLIYGLYTVRGDDTGITYADMHVDSTNKYIKPYLSTSAGTASVVMGESKTATYFVRTMSFGGKNEAAFSANYIVRAFAILDDGTYVYSDVCRYSVYDIARCLYDEVRMSSQEAHDYLYNTILLTVNPDYKMVDYEWGNTILKPY